MFANSFLPLGWCIDKRAEADEMLTAALPLNTLAQPDAAAKHTHTAHTDTLHTREETDLFVLANKFTPTSPNTRLLNHKLYTEARKMSLWRTHRFLILLFGAAGFLGFLNDSIERKAQAAHAGQVSHVYVKLQLLIPQRLGAHCHLRACHHLTEQFAAMEQTSLHHKLDGETHTHSSD